jgi:DNA-binding NarL/FixJ family response regulator
MAKYKEKIINLITGEETYRDYTAAEVAEVEAAQAEAAARTAETEAKATARASALAKLSALGLSADEIAAL